MGLERNGNEEKFVVLINANGYPLLIFRCFLFAFILCGHCWKCQPICAVRCAFCNVTLLFTTTLTKKIYNTQSMLMQEYKKKLGTYQNPSRCYQSCHTSSSFFHAHLSLSLSLLPHLFIFISLRVVCRLCVCSSFGGPSLKTTIASSLREYSYFFPILRRATTSVSNSLIPLAREAAVLPNNACILAKMVCLLQWQPLCCTTTTTTPEVHTLNGNIVRLPTILFVFLDLFGPASFAFGGAQQQPTCWLNLKRLRNLSVFSFDGDGGSWATSKAPTDELHTHRLPFLRQTVRIFCVFFCYIRVFLFHLLLTRVGLPE